MASPEGYEAKLAVISVLSESAACRSIECALRSRLNGGSLVRWQGKIAGDWETTHDH